jgi:uncharacterized protein with HEPN domain
MPPDPVLKHLEHIRVSALFIIEQTEGLTSEQYQADAVVTAAVERHFIIIGEALRRLQRTEHEVAAKVTDFPQIIAFRNIVVHGYDILDPLLVWGIIRKQVPELHDEVVRLIAELEPQDSGRA